MRKARYLITIKQEGPYPLTWKIKIVNHLGFTKNEKPNEWLIHDAMALDVIEIANRLQTRPDGNGVY